MNLVANENIRGSMDPEVDEWYKADLHEDIRSEISPQDGRVVERKRIRYIYRSKNIFSMCTSDIRKIL